ncbi:hypothetical protein ACFZAV_43070 [Streptomyces sp. NPDC008343]|uniref:hypothetical protein n=1 Tax=Streptomyces sp. NPDC008343 TaxID=3364828 RepID=UPI0036EE11E3
MPSRRRPRPLRVREGRKNYAGTSPTTRASDKRHTVQARYVRNNRLADASQTQAFSAPRASPGARCYYRKHLHGCLKTRTLYGEATAWSHHAHPHAA